MKDIIEEIYLCCIYTDEYLMEGSKRIRKYGGEDEVKRMENYMWKMYEAYDRMYARFMPVYEGTPVDEDTLTEMLVDANIVCNRAYLVYEIGTAFLADVLEE